MKIEQHLVKGGSQEVLRVFPLAKGLFELAKAKISSDTSYQVYTDPNYKGRQTEALALPPQFQALVADYPGQYFIVSYENRLSEYYAPESRFQEASLSTARHRYDSNDRVREVFLREYDKSENRGNVIFLTVSDRVNEESVTRLNTAGQGEANEPHGSATTTYAIDPHGNKEVMESKFSRLDEAIFTWKNKSCPVRWLRNLNIHKLSDDVSEMEYRDTYMIGRDERGDTKEEAIVKIVLRTKANATISVAIEVGLGGAPSSAKTLFEDKAENIRIAVHSPKGMKTFTNQMEIIKQDPNYACIFERPVDEKKLLDLVKSKMSMLQNDWDKPQTVFGTNRVGDADRKELG